MGLGRITGRDDAGALHSLAGCFVSHVDSFCPAAVRRPVCNRRLSAAANCACPVAAWEMDTDVARSCLLFAFGMHRRSSGSDPDPPTAQQLQPLCRGQRSAPRSRQLHLSRRGQRPHHDPRRNAATRANRNTGRSGRYPVRPRYRGAPYRRLPDVIDALTIPG